MTDDGGVSLREVPGPDQATRPSLATTLAGVDSSADAERARSLRQMKLVALGFLLGATVVFLVCTWAQSPTGSR
jgi:hypothetical protein